MAIFDKSICMIGQLLYFSFLISVVTQVKHDQAKYKISDETSLQFFFYILFFNFTILYWFCHISTRVPHPEPSSLLPPRTIPLVCPSAPAPRMEEPGRLQSMGSLRVGHD